MVLLPSDSKCLVLAPISMNCTVYSLTVLTSPPRIFFRLALMSHSSVSLAYYSDKEKISYIVVQQMAHTQKLLQLDRWDGAKPRTCEPTLR